MQAARRRLARQVALAVVLLLLAAACGGDGEPGTPAASEPSPVTEPKRTTTTEALTPEEEVEAAYLRSWEVFAEAARTLETTPLRESFAGPALELYRAEIERLRSEGTPVEVSVVNHPEVEFDGELAVISDAYENHSVLVDAETGEPTEPDPDSTVTVVVTMQKQAGKWMVVDIH